MGGSRSLHRWDMGLHGAWCQWLSFSRRVVPIGLSWPQLASGGLSLCLVYARLPLQAQTMSVQILTNLGQYVRPRGRHPMDHAPTCMKSLSMGGGGQKTSSILHVCMRFHLSHNLHRGSGAPWRSRRAPEMHQKHRKSFLEGFSSSHAGILTKWKTTRRRLRHRPKGAALRAAPLGFLLSPIW